MKLVKRFDIKVYEYLRSAYDTFILNSDNIIISSRYRYKIITNLATEALENLYLALYSSGNRRHKYFSDLRANIMVLMNMLENLFIINSNLRPYKKYKNNTNIFKIIFNDLAMAYIACEGQLCTIES